MATGDRTLTIQAWGAVTRAVRDLTELEAASLPLPGGGGAVRVVSDD